MLSSSARLLQLLGLLQQRQLWSAYDLADRLGITERTVKAHLTRIFQQLGVGDRTQAALWAQQNLPGANSE